MLEFLSCSDMHPSTFNPYRVSKYCPLYCSTQHKQQKLGRLLNDDKLYSPKTSLYQAMHSQMYWLSYCLNYSGTTELMHLVALSHVLRFSSLFTMYHCDMRERDGALYGTSVVTVLSPLSF